MPRVSYNVTIVILAEPKGLAKERDQGISSYLFERIKNLVVLSPSGQRLCKVIVELCSVN